MNDFLVNVSYFGILLTLSTFLLARFINKRVGKAILNPLLFSTVVCIAVLLIFDIPFSTYDQTAKYIDFLLTPATICLAVPLYRQFELVKKNAAAVLAGVCAGVAAHMAVCLALLVLFRLDAAQFATLLPKSITSAIGRSLSQELGGHVTITVALIMLTGQLGAVTAPFFLKLFKIHEPLAQGLAIGTCSHAAGTSKAVELGDAQGAASGLAIAVAGLMTVVVANLVMLLV